MNLKVEQLTPEFLEGICSVRIPTPAQQDKLEVRLLTLFVTLSFINDLLGPITYIFRISPSVIYKVASLSHGTAVIGGLFIFALALILPHTFFLLCLPKSLWVRWPRKLATLAAVMVMILWAYLAVLSLPMDAGPLFWLYMRQSIESMGLAFLYAISLNAQLLRTLSNRVMG